jgi:2-polyprenyl-3-methyl-5-hydroxy-6-metoxy-1,4-benzoquinol methylase
MPLPLNPSDYNVESYEDFRKRAINPALSLNEKCGFAEVFRAGQGPRILADVCKKLTALSRPGASICDIGSGCSELAHCIVETTARNGQSLTVIDSPEMLGLLPSSPHLTKTEGPFPDCLNTRPQTLGPFDAILIYSVISIVFLERNIFAFVDAAVQLLAEGGQLLVGDVPNATMRKRFMTSAAGKAYHRVHYSHLPEPKVQFNTLDPGEIDDGVVLGLVARMRATGLHAFVVPQAADLSTANRREDILIIRP